MSKLGEILTNLKNRIVKPAYAPSGIGVKGKDGLTKINDMVYLNMDFPRNVELAKNEYGYSGPEMPKEVVPKEIPKEMPKEVAPKEIPKEIPKEVVPSEVNNSLLDYMKELAIGDTFATLGKGTQPEFLVNDTNLAGKTNGIPPILLSAQQAQESDFVPKKGTSGERGIPQITPKWYYKEAGYDNPEDYGNRLMTDNPYALSEQGRIMGNKLRHRGSIFDALRDYNAGGNLDAGTIYAKDILKRAAMDKFIPEEYR